MFRSMGVVVPTLWVVGSAVALPGCTVDSVVSQAGVPGTTVGARVGDVTPRGPYLDAKVDAGGFRYRLYFPNDETCSALLGNPEGLHFTWLGLMGRVDDGDRQCDAVGVLSLEAWRDRQPRRSREPLPRAPARYQAVYRDDQVVHLLGRFPLAKQLGFQHTASLVAILPNDEACGGFPDEGTASMEYRASGPNPLVLLDKSSLCPVLGLALPPPRTPAAS